MEASSAIGDNGDAPPSLGYRGPAVGGALWVPPDGVATGAPAVTETPAAPANFDAFLAELWPDARSRGISRATFDRAFAGLIPDPRVIAATKRQPEYGKPAGAYVNSMGSNARVATGERRASRHAEIFRPSSGSSPSTVG